ncbi:MAG: TfoX/Sxy family protein [Bacteroidetes bacterium]|nr:TfoX/Sxy family protein [Bacteroidota bacterium]
MTYDIRLADRIRDFLHEIPDIEIQEKEMFKGLVFMINGKMCINVSGNNLMCRFDPAIQEQLENKDGYLPMIMKKKEIKGYCYVEPQGFKNKRDFEFWLNLCLEFNKKAKSSKKLKKN